MNNELTFDQRLTALLALLDDAIKRDSERTPGEWHICNDMLHGREPYIACVYRERDRPFIAGASLWDGANAKALKKLIQKLAYRMSREGGHPAITRIYREELNEIFSNYPDELLRRYL